MSRHGSNGLGSVVSMTGHLMVVETLVSGRSVASSCIGDEEPGCRSVCQTTIIAATNAHNAQITRSLAAIAPPAIYGRLCRRRSSDPAGSVAAHAGRLKGNGGVNENMY